MILLLRPDFHAGLAREQAKLRLAAQVRELRREHALTQRQLAKRAGIPWRDVWRIENCYWTHITIKTIYRVACAVDLAYDIQFVGGADHLRRLIPSPAGDTP